MKTASGKWIIGIDEVGRGALAGPVVVVAAMLPVGATFLNRTLGALKDSKKLTPARREAWAAHLALQPGVSFALARVYPRQIEKINIAQAANTAAKRACLKLFKAHGISSAKTKIFLDGGLFVGSGRLPWAQKAKTIIKADEKINAVKIASIIAKVSRDGLMRRLAKKHPQYHFEVHKGYGTKVHRAAIKKHGPSIAHRLTFMGKSFIMRPNGRSTS